MLDIQYKNPALRKAHIEGIFYFLKNLVPLRSSRLISLTGLPKETLRAFKLSIRDLLDATEEDSLTLNDLGKAFVAKETPQPFKWSLLEYGDKELEAKILEVRKTCSSDPKREYDQFFASAKTSVSEALVVKDKGLLYNEAKIALLGDDDLVSLVLALINPELEITVFEIDRDIISGITKGAELLGIKNIQTVTYDARNSLEKHFINKFDIVLTDPPYTKSGFGLFLKRATELVGYDQRLQKGKYIFIHYGASFKSPEKYLKVQEMINRFGLWQEDVLYSFARYTGAESVGNASTLYILQTTPHTNAQAVLSPATIYTFESQQEEKFPYVDHFVLKLNKVPANILDSKKQLQKLAGEFCNIHKLNVVQSEIFKFKPHGYSLTFILSNSNLLIHTWPEYGAIHIDLITCVPLFNKQGLADTFSRLFQTQSIELTQVE
ncbi:MAG: bis-aminopropyl spermidine synthase family protein [Patescibacteria group bacterium]